MKCSILSLVLLCLIATPSLAHTHKNSRHALDELYCSALAAANRFLHAWQSEDHETGIVMLSDSARRHVSPEQLQQFFSPGTTAAYEIARGTRTKSGNYVFPVVLFSSAAHTHTSTITVTRDGKSDWAVEKLP